MNRLSILWVVFLALSTGGGCAFNPQRVRLAPTLMIAGVQRPSGHSVSVRIVDERPSQELGYRGSGLGKAAKISAEQDLAAVVKDKIFEGLAKKGFKPVEASAAEARSLHIELRLLSYETSVGFWTGGVETRAAMKCIASNGGEKYEKLYREEKERRVLVVPTADTNAAWINETLAGILKQIFDDAALLAMLEK